MKKSPFYARAGALFVLAVSAVSPLAAQDDFFGSLDIEIDTAANEISDSPFSVLGWFSEKVAYGYESPGAPFSRTAEGYSRIESSLFLQADWQVNANLDIRLSTKAYRDKVYDYEDGFAYNAQEVSEMRSRFELRDFYLETRIGELYLKLGNQIAAWGVSENLSIADLINTQNQYSFGQQDIEDLRLQVPAAMFSYPLGDWTVDGVITYKAGTHDVAQAGDEFDQFIQFRNPAIRLQEFEPENEAEYFLRASTHFNNGDFSLVLADVNQNEFSVQGVALLPDSSMAVALQQDRMRAVAAYSSWAAGSWLLFGETGLHLDKAMLSADPLGSPPGTAQRFEKDQWLTAAGIEYNGFRNLTLTFEADLVHTREHDPRLMVGRQDFGYSGRLLWNTLNDRVQVLTVFNRLPGNQGDIFRASLDYDWSDNLELGLLLVTYDAKAGTRLYDYRHNDIFQLQLTYSFQQ